MHVGLVLSVVTDTCSVYKDTMLSTIKQNYSIMYILINFFRQLRISSHW